MEPYRPVVAASHPFDEEQDPDPHESESSIRIPILICGSTTLVSGEGGWRLAGISVGDPDPEPEPYWDTDPGIRICTKMSRIPNTGWYGMYLNNWGRGQWCAFRIKILNYSTSFLLSFLAGKNTGELGSVEETQPVIVRHCDNLHNSRK